MSKIIEIMPKVIIGEKNFDEWLSMFSGDFIPRENHKEFKEFAIKHFKKKLDSIRKTYEGAPDISYYDHFEKETRREIQVNLDKNIKSLVKEKEIDYDKVADFACDSVDLYALVTFRAMLTKKEKTH